MNNGKNSMESNETLYLMAKNFDHGYDGDPTIMQKRNFEDDRINKIKESYQNAINKVPLEEAYWKLIENDPDIKNAVKDMKNFHVGQYRKIDNIPYFIHPLAVAKILSRVTNEKNIIISGLLHDVIEDVKNGRLLLEEKYDEDIIGLIDSVSEQDKKLKWKQRKINYIKHLESSSYETLFISLADRIHNLRSMIESYEKYGEEIRKKFNASGNEQEWFLLSYSAGISKALDKIEEGKIKQKLEVLYKELKDLIAYFLYLLDSGV